jgi:hypothetical protein
MAGGDRWLFYLRNQSDKPIVLVYFANNSLPVADAGEQIKTLRRLETIGDRGIGSGHVLRGKGTQWKPSAMRVSSDTVRPEVCSSLRVPMPMDAMNSRLFPRARTKSLCNPSGHFGPMMSAWT